VRAVECDHLDHLVDQRVDARRRGVLEVQRRGRVRADHGEDPGQVRPRPGHVDLHADGGSDRHLRRHVDERASGPGGVGQHDRAVLVGAGARLVGGGLRSEVALDELGVVARRRREVGDDDPLLGQRGRHGRVDHLAVDDAHDRGGGVEAVDDRGGRRGAVGGGDDLAGDVEAAVERRRAPELIGTTVGPRLVDEALEGRQAPVAQPGGLRCSVAAGRQLVLGEVLEGHGSLVSGHGRRSL
jgi:hypothetical protein